MSENAELFRFWIECGWKYRRKHNPRMTSNIKEYRSRLKYEIKIIEQQGFIDYFMMVSDLVRWAKDNGIAVGPGRGSSAASLVCYLLRITEIDPMQYPMLFERFISPDRTDVPDIDVDFEDTRRDEVFAYAAEKYGQDRVANIINFVRYKARNSLDDVARVYHIPKWKVDTIKGKLLERSEGHPRALKVLEDTRDSFSEVADIFKEQQNSAGRGLPDAMLLEGNYRGLNVHAAGMVIGSAPLNEFTATYQREIDGQIRWGIAYDKRDATYLGLLKIDVLSLHTMGMIAEVCRWTQKLYGDKGITLEELYRIPLDDEQVLEAFRKGDALGIFQFEGPATRRILKLVKPTRFMHLADVNALSRPGADDKAYIAVKEAIDSGFQSGPDPKAHKVIDKHLEFTYGEIVYEEQILQVLRDLGGFQPEELNKLRKVIHDKLGSGAFNEFYKRFESGCAAKGLKADVAQEIWATMATASGYAFNIAHSVSYAHIGYWQMYLKIHYAAAFYAGQLLKCSDDLRRTKLIQEALRHSIEVRPPNLLYSQDNWDVVDIEGQRVIVAGFNSIPGIGPKTSANIVKWRDSMVFIDEEIIDEDGLGLEWEHLTEVKGIGPKTIQKIVGFCESDDPFGVHKTKRILDGIRQAYQEGELPGVIAPTHLSVDITPDRELVTFMGIVRGKKYYDAVAQLQKRTTEDLTYEEARAQLDDPHLLKYVAIDLEDEYNEPIRVRISRWKYPDYAAQVTHLKVDSDVVVVQGHSSDFGGISIQTKELIVLEP